MKLSLCLIIFIAVGLPAVAFGQRRYATVDTDGVRVPWATLAGEQDATALEVNPAGLTFLDGAAIDVVWTGPGTDDIGGLGNGYGAYGAYPLELKVPFITIPKTAYAIGIEKLTPPRIAIAPDPGSPTRLSYATSIAIEPWLSWGVGTHHFIGGPLGGTTTFDTGLAARFGAHFAAGAVVRDMFSPTVDGLPTERYWDGELSLRPFDDDRLELEAGASISDRRVDVEPRVLASVRLMRGLYVRGEFDARPLWQLDNPAFDSGPATLRWDLRGTLGVDVSWGQIGAATYGTVASNAGFGDANFTGSIVARWSDERYPSVVGRGDHLERFRISGTVDDRTLVGLLSRMRRIERDSSVAGVFIVLDSIGGGMATMQELREGIQRMRAHGKRVFSYFVEGTMRDYYVASASEAIYLDAAGGIRMQGMASTLLFFRDLFDKIGVFPQFQKIAEYKSAPEEFTMDHSSDTAKAMHEDLLDDTFNQVMADMAADRKLDVDAMKKIIDQGPYTAGEAGAAKIVDAVVEPRDVDELLRKALGASYWISDGYPDEQSTRWSPPEIAVVFIDGDIVDGKSTTIPGIGEKTSGSETIVKAIDDARDDDRVQAIVLRVNSPGGSSLASEVIAREIAGVKGTKPIIVSMGDVAASGGYFVSAPADEIWADPSTITGSIGIFTGKFDLSKLLASIGVTTETFKRGEHADMESLFRPYTDDEDKLIQTKLRYFYMRFVDTVARGRKMTADAVDAIGRGHVWTGNEGRKNGLVDQIGTVADAIAEAKKRAGMGEYEYAELKLLPAAPGSFLGQLLGIPGALVRMIPASIWLEPDVVQARLPFMVVDE